MQQKKHIKVCVCVYSRYGLLVRRLATRRQVSRNESVRIQSYCRTVVRFYFCHGCGRNTHTEESRRGIYVLDCITTRMLGKLWAEVGPGLNVTFN